MKVLIIEDEERAANHLVRLLRSVAPETEVVARLESVRDSVKFLSANPGIELIFSDIQLADGLSFAIFRQAQVHCPIIFTTAWDHYAIEAFNTNGIDYLLKPVEEDRLGKAVAKARRFSPAPLYEKLLNLVIPGQEKSYKSRFLVKIGDKIKSVPVEEAEAFYSFGKATFLYTSSKRSYSIDYALDQLESILDPSVFFRISRKYIVSLNACTTITAWSNSRLRIRIEGIEDQEIIVARERVQEFRAWLDR